MDRRAQRTRQLLRDALMELILKKGYEHITVQEITDHANLGRATLYLHYPGGKEELLLQSLKTLFEELSEQLKGVTRENFVTSPPSLIAFEHAAANKKLYRVMLGSHGNSSLQSKIRQLIADAIQEQVSRVVSPDLLPVPLPVLGQHAAGALMALITWWLEADAAYTPAEMAQMMHRLSGQPMLAHILQQEAARS
jgi:AcrR family transcriptional regulator